jgi:two-component system NarL family sensor kinase
LTEYLTPAVFFGSLFIIVLVLTIAVLFEVKKGRKEKANLMLQNTNIQYESDVLLNRIEVQEQALNSIFHELYENIGQVLSGVHMKLLSISHNITDKEESKNISELASCMGKTIKDLRNLSHALSGSQIEKIGLIDAVEKEVTFASSIYELECIFTCGEELPELSHREEMLLFRIVQESLFCIFHHAKATKVNVRLGYRDQIITLTIVDNGISSIPFLNDNGITFQHIDERVKQLKGNLNITTKTGEGTIMILTCKPNHGQTT